MTSSLSIGNDRPDLTLDRWLTHYACQTPEAISILAPGRSPLTYGQLYERVREIGKTLHQMGLGKGDRIAIAMPNSPEMAVIFLGVAIFATSAPLNPNYQLSEFEFYLNDLNAKALVLLAGMESPSREIAKKLQIPILEIVPELEAPAGIFQFIGTNAIAPSQGLPHPSAQPDDIALVLHTSGTTARPKLVPLTQANLCASANNIKTSLQLTQTDRCLNVMPLFHIHGLIGILVSSLTAGGSVVCTSGFDGDRFWDWLKAFSPNWYSAVPTIHQSILDRIPSTFNDAKPHSLRFIRSSSAALPPQVMQALETRLNVPVIEAYGMTEAAHQMASNPLPPARRYPGSVGKAAGPEVAIMDELGNLLPQGKIGEVVIRGNNVISGYENNSEANAKAFTNGWFRTGDRGYLDANGYLYLQGRLKEIINRGGEKIAPQEVDHVLMELSGIRQAVTFSVPHPTLGEDVASAVVLQSDVRISPAEIRSFLFDRIADFKVPSQVIIVDEIPKGATGKLQRIGLSEKLKDKLQSDRILPRTAIEEKILNIFTEVLNLENIGICDNFFALGGDSLTGTQVASRLNVQFGINLLNVEIFRKPTIAELAEAIEQLKEKKVNSVSPSEIVPISRFGSNVERSQSFEITIYGEVDTIVEYEEGEI
jgi:oxalate---CoA ligase